MSVGCVSDRAISYPTEFVPVGFAQYGCEMTDQQPFVLLVCNDLFFSSKITGATSSVRVVVDSGGTLEQLDDPHCAGVLLDMNHPSASPVSVKTAVNEGQRLVAFGPHVHTHLFEAAAEAGFETVTRGQVDRSAAAVLNSFL